MNDLDTGDGAPGESQTTERHGGSTGMQPPATRLLGAWQTPVHHLEILDTPRYGRVLRADGADLISEFDEFVYHENLVHPALTAHAAPKRILIVGGGDGGTAEEALKHPAIEQVTLLETDLELLRLAKLHFSAVHRGAFDDRRLQVHAIGREQFLRDTEERFDLIALDPGGPAAPAAGQRSAEFLERCRLALAPGGALVLPLGLAGVGAGRLAEVAQRLNGLFRIVRPYTFYVPLLSAQCALAVCSDRLDPKSITADEIDRRIEQRRLADLRYYNGETHEGVFALPNYLRDLVVPQRVRHQPRSRRLGLVR